MRARAKIDRRARILSAAKARPKTIREESDVSHSDCSHGICAFVGNWSCGNLCRLLGRAARLRSDSPIVTYVPGDKSDIKPGARVFIVAVKQADGTLQGRAWRIGRDGVTPPM
jgi:hypothetical protein